jgi:phosphonopyruvate decarboxylase
MIPCEELFNIFKKNDLDFFTGVPDSTFKDWMSFLSDENNRRLSNIIACNECEATAIAAGYYLSNNKIPVVYLQNSGEGKTVNPLTSLCDREVYSIPLILMIGWRGQPGIPDEPQHKKMGRITLSLLDVLEIPYRILSEDLEEIKAQIKEVKEMVERESRPVAIIIKSGLLEKYSSKIETNNNYEMNREDAIKIIINNLKGSEIVVSTTGKTSRELFEYRKKLGQETRDFYTVGSMGCASSLGFSIALQKTNKRVIIFDGDGAAIMQMGAIATIGHYKPKNFFHFIFDNESHDSTGGQPTVSKTLNFEKIALASGYSYGKTIKNKQELEEEIKSLDKLAGPAMIVVKVNKGSRQDLGRPTKTPLENKDSFMEFLKS